MSKMSYLPREHVIFRGGDLLLPSVRYSTQQPQTLHSAGSNQFINRGNMSDLRNNFRKSDTKLGDTIDYTVFAYDVIDIQKLCMIYTTSNTPTYTTNTNAIVTNNNNVSYDPVVKNILLDTRSDTNNSSSSSKKSNKKTNTTNTANTSTTVKNNTNNIPTTIPPPTTTTIPPERSLFRPDKVFSSPRSIPTSNFPSYSQLNTSRLILEPVPHLIILQHGFLGRLSR